MGSGPDNGKDAAFSAIRLRGVSESACCRGTMLTCPSGRGIAAAWHRIFRMIRFLRHEGFWAEKQALIVQSAGRAQTLERDPPWRINRQRAQIQAKPLRPIRRKPARKWLRNWLTGLLCGPALPDLSRCRLSTSLRSADCRSRWCVAFRKSTMSSFRKIAARL